MSFKIDEIAIYIDEAGSKDDILLKPWEVEYLRRVSGEEVVVTSVEYFDDEIGALSHDIRFKDGQEYIVETSHLRKRPQPPESQSDREARERFLKGCNERPSFNDLMTDLNRPSEETIKRTMANMEKYSGS